MSHHAPSETKYRVNACRKRLRRSRAMQRALQAGQDAAAQATEARNEAGPDDQGNVFEEEGASTAPQFTPEVDRRQRLRAR